MIEIKHRHTGAVLYTAQNAQDVRAAVREAVAAKADLRWSDLSGSDLSGSDLSRSDHSGSNLRSSSVVLAVSGLPSGHVTFQPTPEGWWLRVGCWNGTTDELRALIAQDEGWPEARGAQVIARRPMLAAVADLCDAWAADRADVLAEIVAKWATKSDAAAVSS